ncbi:hypothetical protein BDP27DRAFT_1427843 [Rhodocollybia butyracea]|uniref:Uncharacterized protein n=1 Tax=Rhodocollybia butyracea TaxID=206335 RepID=A0A9P5PI55_9AGAR|nr:hypothetical protein BDP27DRAFT_1427843 [Rhodocollybia butyracea]
MSRRPPLSSLVLVLPFPGHPVLWSPISHIHIHSPTPSRYSLTPPTTYLLYSPTPPKVYPIPPRLPTHLPTLGPPPITSGLPFPPPTLPWHPLPKYTLFY